MTTVFGNQPLTVRMCEFKANMLPAGAVRGLYRHLGVGIHR